jgi:hypothetical protein
MTLPIDHVFENFNYNSLLDVILLPISVVLSYHCDSPSKLTLLIQWFQNCEFLETKCEFIIQEQIVSCMHITHCKGQYCIWPVMYITVSRLVWNGYGSVEEVRELKEI